MNEDGSTGKFISPGMTLLDVVAAYPETEAVFKRYDGKAGVCLCCQALFEPLKEVARKYGLDLAELLAELEAAALRASPGQDKL
jgi:iron-sulfur cluster repair protein YtfE (RIC family)